MELTFFVVIAFLGIVVAVVELVKIFSRRVTEPRRDLEEKVERLEKEIQDLKNRK